MNETVKDPTEMTLEELEALMDQKKKQRAAKEERERKAYEEKRDATVSDIISTAMDLHNSLAKFKAICHTDFEEHAILLNQYGKMPGKSKGGFSLTDATGTLRIVRRRDTEPNWDERSTKAVELIKDFLGDAVKKRDQKLYEILMSFLERNANGDMEYGRVMNLWQHEDKFHDPRWREGLKLIKESYNTHVKGYGYEFKTRGTDGKWQNILLNFSSL